MTTAKTITTIAVISLLAVFALIGIVIYQGQIQQKALGGPVAGEAPTSLIGRSSTITVEARDQAADDTTTRRAVPVYIKDPTGKYVYTGGTVTTASGSAQQYTNGIAINNLPYSIIAFNNTYYGKEWVTKTIASQAESADAEVYLISNDLQFTWFNEDGVSESPANMSLGANEVNSFQKLRIKQNVSNRAANIYGFYIDTNANTNISSISIQDANVEGEGSMPLRSVTTDDYTWKLKTPKLLLEYEFLEINGITIQADGDGCTDTDESTLYVVDGAYFYSSQGQGVLFGPEDDQTTAVDVGMTDQSTAFYCS